MAKKPFGGKQAPPFGKAGKGVTKLPDGSGFFKMMVPTPKGKPPKAMPKKGMSKGKKGC